MSSLEEKLRRIAVENKAYQPQDVEQATGRQAICMQEISRTDLAEASGGLLSYATEDAIRVVCRGGDFEDWDITRAAFVDTETTGLAGGSGTVAFLIGIGFVEQGHFVVEQYFMEDYDVEHDMLSRICRKLQGFDYLVTFNGKCFDAPLIESRSVINRIRQPLDEMEQVDLLHAARRIYKKRLKKCDLQNLEREVLGQVRENDIPGALVPVMFFEYLRSRDFEPMKMVLEHNRRDIVSLLTLLCKLCWAVAEPEQLSHSDDIYSCGRLHERMGRFGEAELCYTLASRDGNTPLKELSMLLKRQGRHDEAAELWMAMRVTGEFGLFPYLELAKHYEHRVANREKAMETVSECLAKANEMGFAAASAEVVALQRRWDRLMKKQTMIASNQH